MCSFVIPALRRNPDLANTTIPGDIRGKGDQNTTRSTATPVSGFNYFIDLMGTENLSMKNSGVEIFHEIEQKVVYENLVPYNQDDFEPDGRYNFNRLDEPGIEVISLDT